jgi:uncharacterized protein (UPF0276 family)
MSPLAGHGVGIGWRPEITAFVSTLPGLRFVEVIAEGLGDELPPALQALRDKGVAMVPHGVKLSLGGAEPVAPHRVAHLARCAVLTEAPLVSEHIAFVRAGGLEAGHLLPVPRTREAIDAIVANVKRTQAELPAPLALEPIAALFDWPDDELSEGDFLREILDQTDTWLLLDIANVYANAVNRGHDPLSALEDLPLDRVAYAHIAGGVVLADGLYHDTHTDPVPPEVLALLPPAKAPAVLLERDGHYPTASALRSELDSIANAL